jgi:hypothetical protein
MSISEKLIESFKAVNSTNSRLKSEKVRQSEFTNYIESLTGKTEATTAPSRQDDGISGERYALILGTVVLDGEHDIQDSGVMDLASTHQASSNQAEALTVIMHYGIAAGGPNIIVTDAYDASQVCRFYELLESVSNSQNTNRKGLTAKVRMLSESHGTIECFVGTSNRVQPAANHDGDDPNETATSNGSGNSGTAGTRINFNASSFNWFKGGSPNMRKGKTRKIDFKPGACKPDDFPKNLTFYVNRTRPRSKITKFILHETGGDSLEGMERALLQKGGGIHFGSAGHSPRFAPQNFKGNDWNKIYQYNDYEEVVWQCPGANYDGIGVEFCNPFYALKRQEPYSDNTNRYGQTIVDTGNWFDAGQMGKRPKWMRYVHPFPPPGQLEAAYALCLKVCADLTNVRAETLSYQYSGHPDGEKHFTLKGGNVGKKSSKSGIASHLAVGNHADGRYIELYVTFRLLGLTASQAYASTKEVATYNQNPTRGENTAIPGSLRGKYGHRVGPNKKGVSLAPFLSNFGQSGKFGNPAAVETTIKIIPRMPTGYHAC